MPINPILLQRTHTEMGRIRLGDKGDRGQPQKLSKFRFTSASERLIKDIATLYGGTPQPWSGAGREEWEVYSDSKSLPVVVVRGGFSQSVEFWGAGGCLHRCDGITDEATGKPCDTTTLTQVGKRSINLHNEAKWTTRLSVMLTELDTLGVWRLESHGYWAATELSTTARIAEVVGDHVSAHLILTDRTAVKDGRTSKYVVPVLDLAVTPRQLVAITQGASAPMAVGSAQAPAAIGAAAAPSSSWYEDLWHASSVEECQSVWHRAGQAGALDDALKAAITARAKEITESEREVTPQTEPEAAADTSAVNDLWFLVVAEAGRQGLTDADMRGAFEAAYGHPVAEATAEQLSGFLAELKATQQVGA